jgi:hypothetical protein
MLTQTSGLAMIEWDQQVVAVHKIHEKHMEIY